MAFDVIKKHLEWLESSGEIGEQIHLDSVNMHDFPFDYNPKKNNTWRKKKR